MNVGSTSCTLHPGALKHKKMDNSKKNGQKNGQPRQARDR